MNTLPLPNLTFPIADSVFSCASFGVSGMGGSFGVSGMGSSKESNGFSGTWLEQDEQEVCVTQEGMTHQVKILPYLH